MSANLSETDLELMRKQFSANPKNRVAQNAVAQTSIDEVALDREVVVGTDTTVSNLLDDWSVTNQKKSGRCWLFAGLNLLRVGAAQVMNLKEFEFSQNHLMFWDKLERANYLRFMARAAPTRRRFSPANNQQRPLFFWLVTLQSSSRFDTVVSVPTTTSRSRATSSIDVCATAF